MLDLLTILLEDAGYRVRRARDGAEALAELARERPSLLLADDRMPHLRGADLVARLRDHPAPAVPAILMSATTSTSPLPGVPFLPKPFDLARLLALVAAALAGDAARPATHGSATAGVEEPG